MTDRWTAEDVERVARALAEQREDDVFSNLAFAGDHWDGLRQVYEADAEAVLAALAEAGRLAPAGGEKRTEWAVRVDQEHPARKEKQGTLITRWTREMVLRAPSVWAGWTPLRREKWVGPWLPVLPDTEEKP